MFQCAVLSLCSGLEQSRKGLLLSLKKMLLEALIHHVTYDILFMTLYNSQLSISAVYVMVLLGLNIRQLGITCLFNLPIILYLHGTARH